jgi:hypothetical protein
LAARSEVSWVSADQEVRSLASTDNTVTLSNDRREQTSASDSHGNWAVVLPMAGREQVGIAILDSGISPSNAASLLAIDGSKPAAYWVLGSIANLSGLYDRKAYRFHRRGQHR